MGAMTMAFSWDVFWAAFAGSLAAAVIGAVLVWGALAMLGFWAAVADTIQSLWLRGLITKLVERLTAVEQHLERIEALARGHRDDT